LATSYLLLFLNFDTSVAKDIFVWIITILIAPFRNNFKLLTYLLTVLTSL